MGSLNPLQNKSIGITADMLRRVRALETARQPYLGDWRDFNTSLFSYDSDNTVDVDSSVVDQFNIGDRVLLTQNSTDKYFYIIKVDTSTNQLILNAGDDFTFDNTSLTRFAISRLSSPIGHPISFNLIPETVTCFISGSGDADYTTEFSGAFGSKNVSYSMLGPVLTVTFSFVTTSLPANAVDVRFSLPFFQINAPTTEYQQRTVLTYGSTAAGNPYTTFAFSGDISFSEIKFSAPGTVYVTGTWQAVGTLVTAL